MPPTAFSSLVMFSASPKSEAAIEIGTAEATEIWSSFSSVTVTGASSCASTPCRSKVKGTVRVSRRLAGRSAIISGVRCTRTVASGYLKVSKNRKRMRTFLRSTSVSTESSATLMVASPVGSIEASKVAKELDSTFILCSAVYLIDWNLMFDWLLSRSQPGANGSTCAQATEASQSVEKAKIAATAASHRRACTSVPSTPSTKSGHPHYTRQHTPSSCAKGVAL